MSFSTGQKVGMVIGGVVLATAVGFGIYYATRKPALVVSTGNTNTGGGSTTAPPKVDPKKKLTLAQILEIIAKIQSYTKESFPLKPGMMGPNVMAMQKALRDKFQQLNVGTDGMFGIKTLQALNEIGYTSYAVNSVSRADFDEIMQGHYKV